MFRIASEKCYETNLFKSIQTIPVLVEFYPSVVVRHICRIPLLIFLRFIQRIIIAEKKIQIKLHVFYGKTTYNCHMDDIRLHTSNIRMAHDYIRATYGWHTSTYEWHTDGTRLQTSDIRMAHNYIQKTYGWHANDMRMT